MRSFLNELIQQVEVLSMTEILTQILVAAALGFVIYLSYYMSHTGTIYSRKFNTSLVVLAVLTTVVMTAIGNNVALSLGMVGALSIVRFRTAIKDSRDTVEMKAFHMMENREDAAVARATVGMIMMAKSKEGGQSGTI